MHVTSNYLLYVCCVFSISFPRFQPTSSPPRTSCSRAWFWTHREERTGRRSALSDSRSFTLRLDNSVLLYCPFLVRLGLVTFETFPFPNIENSDLLPTMPTNIRKRTSFDSQRVPLWKISVLQKWTRGERTRVVGDASSAHVSLRLLFTAHLPGSDSWMTTFTLLVYWL